MGDEHEYAAGSPSIRNIGDGGCDARWARAPGAGGDFLESVPPGGDAYLLSLVLHDWPDDQARHILANVAAAGGSGARLLVLDFMVPPGDAPHLAKISDLNMLQGLLSMAPITFANIFLFVITLVIMVILSPVLTIVTVLVAPALYFIALASRRRLFPPSITCCSLAPRSALRARRACVSSARAARRCRRK